MFGLGMTELVIVLVIVLLVFGGSKISGVGRSLGEAISEFKEAVKPDEKVEKKETPSDSDKAE
ncbi:MAG: twin-arginine translocase TatA/TatE family subunit [Candidatus Hydrogenedentes bacterium]|nr:twin-arginine translocase TatA/TatE family subunit [Candidatus Hydrogenedentota bacterium]